MDQIQTVVWHFFCASFGRSLCRGNEHYGIEPNMLRLGHHDCSTKAVFLCSAVKLQVGPCWHIELSILRLLHLSISIHLSNSFGCSLKFFHLKITLGLALGVPNHGTTPMSTKACFRGISQTNLHKSSSQLATTIWDFRFCIIDPECWGAKLKTLMEFWKPF